jgi:hypothetical protein
VSAPQISLSPDGHRYIAATQQRVARPFHYRWLIPKLLAKAKPTVWFWLTRLSLVGLLPAMYWYVGGGWHGLAAAACVVGLSGVWAINRRLPILVDAPGMLLALLSADLFHAGWWPLAVLLAVVGGCVRETTPIFAALFAWNPLALLGLIPVGVRHLQAEGPDVLDQEARWILDHPVKASRKYHTGIAPWTWLLPWGAGLLALGHPTLQLAAVLAAAYAQCLIATDTVRLYMWAFPVVIAAAVEGVPTRWLLLLVLAHLVNPFATGGA